MKELMDIISNSVALITFLSIFGAGLVFSIVSLIFGGDHDTDSDFSDSGDLDEGFQGPRLLSVRGLSLFLTGFGAVASVAQVIWSNVLISSASGLMFGFVFAFLMLAVIKFFVRQQSNSFVSSSQIDGATGVVTTGILPGAYGEVRLNVAGTESVRMATSDVVLRTGTPIKVVRNLGSSVEVSGI